MRGYDQHEDAKSEWALFCTTAIIPQAINAETTAFFHYIGSQPSPSPASRVSPAHVGHCASSAPMVHHTLPAPVSRTTPTHCPLRAPATQILLSPTSAVFSTAPAITDNNQGQSGHQQATPKKFYVILARYTPGVFFD